MDITAKSLFDAWVAEHPNARQAERKYARAVADTRVGDKPEIRIHGVYVAADRKAEIREQVDAIFASLGGTPPEVPANFKR